MATTYFTIDGNSVVIDDTEYTRRVLSDGTVTYVHRDLSHRIVVGRVSPGRTKFANQQKKAVRRKSAGKPSYRQRQRSARAAKSRRSSLIAN